MQYEHPVFQTIDEEIHHWPHNDVKNSGYFILSQRPSRRRLKYINAADPKKRQTDYVGAAGTEGFGPGIGRMDAQNAGEDLGIRNEESETGHCYVHAHHDKNNQFIDKGACAGELEERRDVTHVMIGDVGITEVESQNASSVSHRTHKTHDICTHHQHEADLKSHGDLVQQGLIDGHISVIGHRCQDTALISNKEREEKELCHALSIGDDVLFHKTHKHSGDYDTGVTEIDEGQVAEEVVHGGVQVKVQTNQSHQAQAPHHSDHIDSQEEEEEAAAVLAVVLIPTT